MPLRPFQLSEDSVILPRGTRVILKTDVRGEDGFTHRTASVATVREVFYNTYTLETPSGRLLTVQRDQITSQREDALLSLGRRQWNWRRLRDHVLYSAVVGSQAWGLASASSDEDVRGCFLAPFEEHSGLYDYPQEVQDPSSDAAYWEVGKFVHQALRGDANTLETLWSPLHKTVAPLGETLLERRQIFVSMNVLGSFGRYAQSQFKKIERALRRDAAIRELLDAAAGGGVNDLEQAAEFLRGRAVAPNFGEAKKEVKAVCRSLFDRGQTSSADFSAVLDATRAGRAEQLLPPPHRPKNAYNLLRLLHSCLSWLTTGEPLIEVPASLREELLAIKDQQVSIDEVVARSKQLAAEIDDAAGSARLPEQPDYDAADDFLRICRRHAAHTSLLVQGIVKDASEAARSPGATSLPGPLAADDPFVPTLLSAALPPDVDIGPLREFLGRYCDARSPEKLTLLWLGLTGAHAYGFPSPDSDLDLKGIHVAPAEQLLGLSTPPEAIDFLGDHQGREYDFTSNELGKAAALLLAGNGNMLERLLGPLPVVTTAAGRQLAELARASLSRACAKHYGGFFRGMCHEYATEAGRGERKAKRLLYAYRVALTGIHLLRSSEVVTNVRMLSDTYGYPRVAELVAIKARAELTTLEESDDRLYLEELERLRDEIEVAEQESSLPESPRNADEVERFVVRYRLQVSRQSRE